MGGIEVMETEVKEFASCIEECELEEMTSVGNYYTWTNKSIWIRIDRVFINQMWCGTFDFTHV